MINLVNDLNNFKKNLKKSNITKKYQNQFIPIYEPNNLDLKDPKVKNDIYNQFFNESGLLIVKNAYTKNIMKQYNFWCRRILNVVENNKNFTLPKQKKNLLINNLIERMVENNSNLLIELLTNKIFTQFIDILLGFGCIGSCTGHWNEPGCDRQLSHVDYPINVGSAPFWEDSIQKVKNLVTDYQLNHILPFCSVQVLIAGDDMGYFNGSIEVIPFSHKLKDIDLLIQDPNVASSLNQLFINVKLEQGDLLIFNRRLCHREGKNISNFRINTLSIQCIWLWGIGQEKINYKNIMRYLEQSKEYQSLSEPEKENLKMRLKQPYPIDVTKNT